MKNIIHAARTHRRLVIATTLGFAIGGAILSLVLPPTYTGRTTFIVPQQSQGGAAAAMASSLSALSALADLNVGMKDQAQQFVSLMNSYTIEDRLVDRFHLMDLYHVKFHSEARDKLDDHTRLTATKKDNMILVEVDDKDPVRAAAMANAYIEELQRLMSTLNLTEAQQRRAFFEKQLAIVNDKLTQAQLQLESSGFNRAALNTDASAAAEAYARAKADAVAAAIRLKMLRSTLAEGSPEVRQQAAMLSALEAQVHALEKPMSQQAPADYVGAYRNFKYEEALFEIYARQFELAKLDESQDAPVIQVVDKATPPEKRSKPKRVNMTLGFTVFGFVISLLWALYLASKESSTTAQGVLQTRETGADKPSRG